MSGKTFVLKTPPTVAAAAENWVQAPAKAEAAKPAKLTRFTVELDEELHFRMKMYCTQHRLSMADYIRDVLAERFPAASPAPSESSTAA